MMTISKALAYIMEKESKHFSRWHPLPKSSVYVEHEQDKAKEKINMIWNFFWAWSNMILTIDLETLFKVTAHSLSKCTLWMGQIGPRGEKMWSRQGLFKEICYDLNLRNRNWVQGHCIPFNQMYIYSVGKLWARLGKGKRICASAQVISDRWLVTVYRAALTTPLYIQEQYINGQFSQEVCRWRINCACQGRGWGSIFGKWTVWD